MLNNTSKIGRALLATLALGLTGSVGFAADAHYYVNDPLATTVAIADAAGEIAAIEADAFGAPLAAGEAPSRYTGKPYDTDLGAYVFPFRNYRPEEGRWMSADPSGFPDGLNNNTSTRCPLTEIDPLGLDIWVTSGGPLLGLHQELNIGTPGGSYDTFSFGGNALAVLNPWNNAGDPYLVNPDNRVNNPTDMTMKTSAESDSIARAYMLDLVMNHGGQPYRLWGSNCREFTQQMFKFFKEDLRLE
jgi:RHS repeat-associated protein